METWASYRLEDFLLFAPRTYYRLFELHNAALWPLQWVLGVLGAAVTGLLAFGWQQRQWQRAVAPLALGLLAVCWISVGVLFHWQRYAAINWAADAFGTAFLVQAALLALTAAVCASGTPPPAGDGSKRLRTRRAIGLMVAVHALVLHPMLAPLGGRGWAQAEWFGVAPDPTVLATLGLLLMLPACGNGTAARWLPRLCWPVPLAWCAISAATLTAMDSPLAWLMAAGALVCVGASALRRSDRG